ncbi:lipoate--protein ligase [Malassezia yamatoensis]|uniref:Putative lipoate-protein ligase A n=1 Tax=Malassezia yamatoensis TaxID=253288 RepID=A0AAJ6CG36_9BASI|nr:lipoate--protein ligase [Malassezia yamatoensis]
MSVAKQVATHRASGAKVVWSQTLNPYFNLAYEDYLLRLRPKAPVCFLYRNTPCVVVGRNQNLWAELDARAMQRAQVPFIRRRSGGGTVYHDEGNLNFCFYVARNSFARHTHTELIADALRKPPTSLPDRFNEPPIQVNDRNDLYVYDRNTQIPSLDARRKVSGSAYKISSQHAYHHGTLLLDADLGKMHLLKRQSKFPITSKGVDSVSSPVANLCEVFPEQAASLIPSQVFQVITDTFSERYGGASVKYVDETHLHESELVDGKKQDVISAYGDLQSWDWVYGSSPQMHIRVSTKDTPSKDSLEIHITVDNGIVTEANLETYHGNDKKAIISAVQKLVGERYDAIAPSPPSIVKASNWEKPAESPIEQELRNWLGDAL